jgi:hypothetical protein
MRLVGKMANDFYSNLISGFAQGLGLGGRNFRQGEIRRGEIERESESLSLFDELVKQVDSADGTVTDDSTQIPQKEALLATLAPGILSFYKSYRKKKGKKLAYDEPFLYYSDAEGNRTWLENGAGEKIKNSFYKSKVVDKFMEEKEGKKQRVHLYEDGSKRYFEVGEKGGSDKNTGESFDPVEFQKKLLESYRDGKISLKDYKRLKERGTKMH